MVLPGWNVSEPIDLAHKLYNVVEALRIAPDSAKAFVSKISNFSGHLKELQRILESDTASPSHHDHEHLRATIIKCQACVKRCEEYGEGFRKLTKDGRGKMDGAAQAARWALQEKRIAHLRDEIDGQISDITLALGITAFADGRTRQGSHSTMESFSPPLQPLSFTSLPPYSSPQTNWAQAGGRQHAKTPADLLGLDISHTRKTSNTHVPDFHLESRDIDARELSAPLQTSPDALRPLTEQTGPYNLDSNGEIELSERRRNTVDATSVSPQGLGISSTISEGSRPVSRVFTSPTLSSQRTSTTGTTSIRSRPNSNFSLEPAVLEMMMANLEEVRASYYKAKSRISYPVSTIESFRIKQTGHRYIIISPPTSSNIKLYFVPPIQFPPIERIIPHSEHPRAYESPTTHRIKFIYPYVLRSQKILSERQPADASSVLSPSLTPVSSAASVASSRNLGSPVITTNSVALNEESERQEYDFKNVEDYRKFQELLMGPGVKLQLEIPIMSITAKRYETRRPTEESRLQNLRLWQFGGRQTLMFFANGLPQESRKYKEYKMENLRPVETKSKTTIRLDFHLPGTVRRRSSTKSPLIIAEPFSQEQAGFDGDTDRNDMTQLDYLSIEFGCAKDRTTFLHEAKFHGPGEEPMTSPFTLSSRFSPS